MNDLQVFVRTHPNMDFKTRPNSINYLQITCSKNVFVKNITTSPCDQVGRMILERHTATTECRREVEQQCIAQLVETLRPQWRQQDPIRRVRCGLNRNAVRVAAAPSTVTGVDVLVAIDIRAGLVVQLK